MNLRQLKEWLETLPPEMDEAEIASCVGGVPLDAKRVVAYRYKGAGEPGIVVNSMGTHLGDDFYKSVEIVSTLHCTGEVTS